MRPFLSEDFLLKTETAKLLYRDYAKDMPIFDYHCHVSPREILEDRRFSTITELWLGADHYKWRLLRANGVSEEYITGNAPDREKFRKFAEALPRAIGNPMYHWCHMELKNYFGYTGLLNGSTADEVYDLAERKLREANMSVRGLIRQSNVAFIGTTDDPTDSLEWHEKLMKDASFQDVTVAPSFRPDKALNADKPGYPSYINTLSAASGVAITDLASLKAALENRMTHFAERGCRASDHGLDFMVYEESADGECDTLFRRAMTGELLAGDDDAKLKTELLVFCAAVYARLGWVMQLHMNCLRNPNSAMLARLGPDTGFDCIGPYDGTHALARFLDRLYRENSLPRTVLYSLDGGDNASLCSLIGAFQSDDGRGKLQHGSAWWFNDHNAGMRDQMTTLASLGILGNFIGMLTDSRSFLSYARHEYFRRILCDMLGDLVENGEYPADLDTLGELVRDISYRNACRYFGVEKQIVKKPPKNLPHGYF